MVKKSFKYKLQLIQIFYYNNDSNFADKRTTQSAGDVIPLGSVNQTKVYTVFIPIEIVRLIRSPVGEVPG
jgi:hypothetical protein